MITGEFGAAIILLGLDVASPFKKDVSVFPLVRCEMQEHKGTRLQLMMLYG